MQDVVGTQPSKWCAGCHDHAVFFNGRFDRPIKEQIDTPEAQAGLACTSCHSITQRAQHDGAGRLRRSSTRRCTIWPRARTRCSDALHDTLLYLAPEPHRDTFMKPFHREQTAEFCSTCHKVHLDVPVNGYRWFRGFNDYDNWQASGVSGQGARSFYYPPKPQKCADCHMPLVDSNDPAAKNGKVRSHRFPAANTALPFVNHDAVQLKAVQDFLRDGQISVDVFGITRAPAPARSRAGASRAGSEPAARQHVRGRRGVGGSSAQRRRPRRRRRRRARAARQDPSRRSGAANRCASRSSSARARSATSFPAGRSTRSTSGSSSRPSTTTAACCCTAARRRRAAKGPVDPGAHFYRSLQLDEHGNPINKRNAWMTRSVAYVRLIPPGAADTVHYRLQIPPDAGDKIVLRAKVNYRKFAWWNTQWAFAGVRDPRSPRRRRALRTTTAQWMFTGDTSKRVGADRRRFPTFRPPSWPRRRRRWP